MPDVTPPVDPEVPAPAEATPETPTPPEIPETNTEASVEAEIPDPDEVSKDTTASEEKEPETLAGLEAPTPPVASAPTPPEPPQVPTNVPNAVEVHNQISMVLQTVEGAMSRVQGLQNAGAEVVDLAGKFHEVRSLIADKLGLMENEAGDLIRKL